MGKDERTETDKNRERRKKKQHQKNRAREQEKKLQEKLKKAGPGGKLNTKSTLKVVEKAVKEGHVKLVSFNMVTQYIITSNWGRVIWFPQFLFFFYSLGLIPDYSQLLLLFYIYFLFYFLLSIYYFLWC